MVQPCVPLASTGYQAEPSRAWFGPPMSWTWVPSGIVPNIWPVRLAVARILTPFPWV